MQPPQVAFYLTPPLAALAAQVAFYREAKARFDADEAFQREARAAVVQLQAGDERSLLTLNFILTPTLQPTPTPSPSNPHPNGLQAGDERSLRAWRLLCAQSEKAFSQARLLV